LFDELLELKLLNSELLKSELLELELVLNSTTQDNDELLLLLLLDLQHFGAHCRRDDGVMKGHVLSQAMKLPSLHFVTQVGHGSASPTVMAPPKQSLEYAGAEKESKNKMRTDKIRATFFESAKLFTVNLGTLRQHPDKPHSVDFTNSPQKKSHLKKGGRRVQ
jgi:hypothetical protein